MFATDTWVTVSSLIHIRDLRVCLPSTRTLVCVFRTNEGSIHVCFPCMHQALMFVFRARMRPLVSSPHSKFGTLMVVSGAHKTGTLEGVVVQGKHQTIISGKLNV